MSNTLSTICKNTYGCAEYLGCATTLYLMSMLSQAYSFIIDRRISVSRHGREVVDGPNSIYKRFLIRLMATVQLTGEKVMTHRWLYKLKPINPVLVWP